MTESEREQIKKSLIEMFNDLHITSLEQFKSIGEEESLEIGLYDHLKSFVLEVYDIDDLDLIDELTSEVLE